MFKVGDKVRVKSISDEVYLEYFNLFDTGIIVSVHTNDSPLIQFDKPKKLDGMWYCDSQDLELIVNETTTAQHELDETVKIVELLEDYVWYENKPKRAPRAKSGDTIATLIQVLVGKGLISSQDVTRILNMKK
jgi:hypothetical protein